VRRFVVLDAMGVLYRHGNVVGGVLVPYLRDRGCSSSESEIREAYRRCTLGLLSTDELWAELGVGDSAPDDEYCGRHELNLVAAAGAGFRPWLFRSEDTSAHRVDGSDVPVARDMAELLTQGRRGWCED
jgi:putative hydrolase of the HAD superfamily